MPGSATRDVTRQRERRASAPTRAARSRRPPHRHHYTCAPRAFRAPPFVVATPRHFLAHVGDAAGRVRALDSNAINAAVVNERRPRPGGWRPLIGRVAGDDRPALARGRLYTPSPRSDRASVEDVAFSARRHSPRAKSVFIYQ